MLEGEGGKILGASMYPYELSWDTPGFLMLEQVQRGEIDYS